MENTKIKSFLDLGCGNGRVIYFFNKYFKIKYYGIEFFEKPYNFTKILFSNNENIQIKNVALSSDSGTKNMKVPLEDSGRSTLEELNKLTDVKGSIKIKLIG